MIRKNSVLKFLEFLGIYPFLVLKDWGNFFAIFYQSTILPFQCSKNIRSVFLNILVKQIYFTGVQAIRPTIFISLVIGGIVIIQSVSQLAKLGGEKWIGTILVVVIVREIGPLIVSFLMIGRSASAITTEISEMRVSGQYMNLMSSGINPSLYVFAPRVWGMIISMLGLQVCFIVSALLGGFLMARAISYVNFLFVVKGFFSNLVPEDIIGMIFKNFFLANAISIVAIKEALKVKSSSTEIPQATSRTVVKTIFYVLIIDIIFAAILYI